MAIYFAPIARLLGDLIVSLPPLQSLIASGEEVYLIERSSSQCGLAGRIPGLAGSIKETDFLKMNLDRSSCFVNLRDHPLQTDYIWGSREFETKYPAYRIAEIVREISLSFGITYAAMNMVPLKVIPRYEDQGKTVLIPGTASPIKKWPTEYWIELFNMLSASGQECLLLGEPEQSVQIAELIEAGLPWKATPLLCDALDMVSSAKQVVSVDTGLMHLAVHQGIQTVALFREYITFLREFPHATNLVAPPCSASCLSSCKQEEFSASPNASVVYDDWNHDAGSAYWANLSCIGFKGSRCMDFITPETVWNALAARKLMASKI